MTEQQMTDRLQEAFDEAEGELRCKVYSTRQFEEDGVLTNNKGFTVCLRDGSEFQVKVVQSKG